MPNRAGGRHEHDLSPAVQPIHGPEQNSDPAAVHEGQLGKIQVDVTLLLDLSIEHSSQGLRIGDVELADQAICARLAGLPDLEQHGTPSLPPRASNLFPQSAVPLFPQSAVPCEL